LEKALQNKKEVIEMQIEVLDEYRKENLRLIKTIEKKDEIIKNLKDLVNAQNRMVLRTAQKD
jgi:predicted RNase H-like HicB family nuclease